MKENIEASKPTSETFGANVSIQASLHSTQLQKMDLNVETWVSFDKKEEDFSEIEIEN